MQIIRLAAGKKRQLKISIDYKTGTMRVAWVDSPDGEGCHSGANEKFLKDMLAMEIPGFGQVEQVDSGLTDIGFEQRMKNRTSPLTYSPLGQPSKTKPASDTPLTHKTEDEPQLDTGFGV